MAYVPVPKDLTKVKTKVMFGLTRRQLICFGAAALVGVPLFFLTKGSLPQSAATFLMILVMLPFFLFAMYEKHGQPLEVILGNMIRVLFLTPKERPYQTENAFTAERNQRRLKKEVNAIVKRSYERQTQRSTKTGKAHTGRKEADRRSNEAGKGGRQKAHRPADHTL